MSLSSIRDPGILMLVDLDKVGGECSLECWDGAGGVSHPTPFLRACLNDIV